MGTSSFHPWWNGEAKHLSTLGNKVWVHAMGAPLRCGPKRSIIELGLVALAQHGPDKRQGQGVLIDSRVSLGWALRMVLAGGLTANHWVSLPSKRKKKVQAGNFWTGLLSFILVSESDGRRRQKTCVREKTERKRKGRWQPCTNMMQKSHRGASVLSLESRQNVKNRRRKNRNNIPALELIVRSFRWDEHRWGESRGLAYRSRQSHQEEGYQAFFIHISFSQLFSVLYFLKESLNGEKPQSERARESVLHRVSDVDVGLSSLVFSPLQTPAVVLTGNDGELMPLVAACWRDRLSPHLHPHWIKPAHDAWGQRTAAADLPSPSEPTSWKAPPALLKSQPAQGASSCRRATRITQRDDWTSSCWGARLTLLPIFEISLQHHAETVKWCGLTSFFWWGT